LKRSFYSNGKLLLTGEYVVLDGAKALALPTKKGQTLTLAPRDNKELLWNSYDENNNAWFSASFSLETFEVLKCDNSRIAATLLNILKKARDLQPEFLTGTKGVHAITKVDFPRNWGLGTSSTLINNIAQWAKVDAFTLLQNSFGGSGYDIAAAQHNKPIFYSLERNVPQVDEITLSWDFTDALFFVHLNQKQDSKKGILRYKMQPATSQELQKISDLTKKLLLCYSLSDFRAVIEAHEHSISKIIGLPTVKDTLFPDFTGSIKSLGAWGGDFILATGVQDDMNYFRKKGYTTIVEFNEMLL